MKLSFHRFSCQFAAKFPCKTASGFTLTELLVAISLSSIVVSGAGFGLVTIMEANAKTEKEVQRRTDLNRALDYITEDIRMASQTSSTKPSWGWDSLSGTSPIAKLYLQIPLSIQAITASSDQITLSNHGFSNGNAIRFTEANLPSELSANTTYYITRATENKFKIATSIANAQSGTAVNFANNYGSMQINRLLTYYTRETTGTAWHSPNTINRAAGPCTAPYAASNCPALVDAITSDGFTATVTDARKVSLELKGYPDYTRKPTEAYSVTSQAFARSN